jgi:very-short-patch-repair endonuclease
MSILLEHGRVNREVSELLVTGGGVIGRRRHPHLGAALDHLHRTGLLVAVLPGIYVHRDLITDWRVLALAACTWDSRVTIVGDAAAALSFWPELVPLHLEVAGRRCASRSRFFTFSQRVVPPELTMRMGEIQLTTPDLTALDLTATRGGDVVDRALRSRMATLAGMHAALQLTSGRTGNADRRRMLLDSRDEPWSEAERLAHRHLRSAGISGWKTNVRFRFGARTHFLDIAFVREDLVVEIDGLVHLSPDLFESDRRRGNDLLLAGKRTLHFTWRMLTDEAAEFVRTVQRARSSGG